jgi:hypothetical protein
MTTIQIKHRDTNAVLFECEAPECLESGLHVKHALELAVSRGATLVGALLDGASLDGASLDGALLRNASLVRASLAGASLNGASLRNASLDGASLNGASLDGASLDGASLNRASLGYASLDGASLDGASLRNASLAGASLRNASLAGASLDGASLAGTSLDGASLDGGEQLIGERPAFSIGPIGSRQDILMAFSTDQGMRLKTGCFFGPIEKFREKLIAEHGENIHRKEYEAALLLIETHADLWPAEVPQ